MAVGFGPDMAKAAAASERIFKMLSEPSLIDPCEDENNSEKKRISSSNDI